MSSHDHSYHPVLGKFTADVNAISRSIDAKHEELRAAHERIDQLKTSLAEMVDVYWGEGDGIDPPPHCILRAQAALAEEVIS